MTLDRLTPVHSLEIFQPRWRDRKVLLAKYKIGTHNRIYFTKAPTLKGDFYISGAKASTYPIETNGKIAVYAVPIDELEPLERN